MTIKAEANALISGQTRPTLTALCRLRRVLGFIWQQLGPNLVLRSPLNFKVSIVETRVISFFRCKKTLMAVEIIMKLSNHYPL